MKINPQKRFPIIATTIIFTVCMVTAGLTAPSSFLDRPAAARTENSTNLQTSGKASSPLANFLHKLPLPSWFAPLTPAVTTNKTGFFSGEAVTITGSGYQAGQVVVLQITHADGTAEAGGNHNPFAVTADAGGGFTSTWNVGQDANGNNYVLTADGTVVTPIDRIAVVQTDKYDYQPGETARITATGFNPGESVTLQVVHSNGRNDGNGHQPFTVTAGSDGSVQTSWYVDPDDSLGSIFRLTAAGSTSGLSASSTFTDVLLTVIDDKGPDDQPGQKDLSQMSSDLGPTAFAITWNWDDTAFGAIGGNTGDGCALIDTDQDGKANYSFCVGVDGDPAGKVYNRLYSCGNSRSDRCDQPATPITTFSSTSTASVVPNSDPFRLAPFNVAHSDGNDCDNNANCLTADTVANVTLQLSDVGGASIHPKLINVCSYPSGQPNSDPSDCVVTPDSGFLTIVKVATPNDGTAFPFGASISSQSNVNSWTINGSGSVQSISYAPTTTLNLSETVPNGWQLDSASCFVQTATPTATGTKSGNSVNGIAIQSGLETICTFNDSLSTASLTLNKVVVNNNGGTAKESDWTLTADGTGTNDLSGPGATGNADVTGSVLPGTFALSESGTPTGYTASQYSCVTNGGSPVSGNSITLAANDVAVCTITNDDNAPSLTLDKSVSNTHGGTRPKTDWTLTATGTGGSATNLSGAGGASSGTNFRADTYTLAETGTYTGYTNGTTYSCVKNNGTPFSTTTITLALGDTATCTITNSDNAPMLHLRKTVTNDNGGTATVADFTLTATGAVSGNNLTGTSPVDSGTGLQADTFTLSETASSAASGKYTASDWVCSGGTQGTGANKNKITLAVGDDATCTITNDDKAGTLVVKKLVINDNGGTKIATDFKFKVDGGTATSFTQDGANALKGLNSITVDAGSHSVVEDGTPITGYSTSYSNCSNVSVANGATEICTITNDDIAPSLTLNKVVVNNNGGLRAESEWTLTANGGAAGTLSGAGASGSTDVQSGTGFKAGTYDLSETGPTDYTSSGFSCSKNAGSPTTVTSIVLAVGDTATCTITNDDKAAHLKLIKYVTNDNGGTAVATDWTLTADGTGSNDQSGAGGFDKDVNADTYALSESTGPAGYTPSGFDCGGGVVTSVTLGLGESKTCSITNDDIAPSLTLDKIVVNDSGGSRTESEWTLTANGGTAGTLSGSGASGSTDVQSTATFKAGTYALSESGPTDYTSSGYSCSKNSGTAAAATSIVLAVGDTATCTITNNDKAAHLKLVKVIVNDNGGTLRLTDVTLTANGPTLLSRALPVGANSIESDVNAGSYPLSESFSATGYSSSGYNCSKNGGTSYAAASITLALGDSAICTITNNDIPPQLHLRKLVVNDNGGTATLADFTLTANGTGTNDISGTSPVDSGTGLQADTWALSETSKYGYTASAWSCVGGSQSGSNISVGIGGSATCTITNDDQPGTIVVVKNAQPAQGSFAFTTTGSGYNSFPLTGATTNNGNKNSQSLNAGSYTVRESTQLGWTLTGIGGSTDTNTPYNCVVTGSGGSTGSGDLSTQTATINLKNGDTVTCTFENTGNGATRTQGFWATHPQLADIAWNGGTKFGHTFPGVTNVTGIGDKMFCGRPLTIDALSLNPATGNSQVLGGFWASVSKTTTNAKRSALDQARMQALQQLLAAELNASAFGSAPLSGSFTAWESALCGTNQSLISNAQSQAAAFNSQGDSSTFTPGTSADSKNARLWADLIFWDIVKP